LTNSNDFQKYLYQTISLLGTCNIKHKYLCVLQNSRSFCYRFRDLGDGKSFLVLSFDLGILDILGLQKISISNISLKEFVIPNINNNVFCIMVDLSFIDPEF